MTVERLQVKIGGVLSGYASLLVRPRASEAVRRLLDLRPVTPGWSGPTGRRQKCR